MNKYMIAMVAAMVLGGVPGGMFAQVAQPEVIAYDGMELTNEPGNQLSLVMPGSSSSIKWATSPGGIVAFVSRTVGPTGNAGVFRITPAGLRRIAQPGMAIEGPMDNAPWSLGLIERVLSVNDAGDVLFTGYGQGANGPYFSALFLSRADGSLQTLAMRGGAVPDMPGWTFSNVEWNSSAGDSQSSRTMTPARRSVVYCGIVHPDLPNGRLALLGVEDGNLRVIAASGQDAGADFVAFQNLETLSQVNASGQCLFIADNVLYLAHVSTEGFEQVFDPAATYSPYTSPAGTIKAARINDSGFIAVATPTRIFRRDPQGTPHGLLPQSGTVGSGTRLRIAATPEPSSLGLDHEGTVRFMSAWLTTPGVPTNLSFFSEVLATIDTPRFAPPRVVASLTGEIESGMGLPCLSNYAMSGRAELGMTTRAHRLAVSANCNSTASGIFTLRDDGVMQRMDASRRSFTLPTGEQRTTSTFIISGTGSSPTLAETSPLLNGSLIRFSSTQPTGWVLYRLTPPPLPDCGDADFNRDGVTPDSRDILDFLSVFAGNPCPALRCDTIDINRDGVYPASDDIDAFLTVFAGGGC